MLTFRRSRPVDAGHCVRLCALGAVAILITACGGGGGESAATSSGAPTLIQLDGSSTVFPISEAVAEEFQKANPTIRVTVGISGTGGGFQKFCRGETDISDASRPIRPAEIETCAKAGIEYIELPIAYDGLAVVVNPKNTWATSVTVAELKTLWSPDAQGKVLKWNQACSSRVSAATNWRSGSCPSRTSSRIRAS